MNRIVPDIVEVGVPVPHKCLLLPVSFFCCEERPAVYHCFAGCSCQVKLRRVAGSVGFGYPAVADRGMKLLQGA